MLRVLVFDLPLKILQLLIKSRFVLLLKGGNLIQVVVFFLFETGKQFLIRGIFLLEFTVPGEQLFDLLLEDALAFESLLESRFSLFEFFVFLSELFYNFGIFALIRILYRFLDRCGGPLDRLPRISLLGVIPGTVVQMLRVRCGVLRKPFH